MTTVGGALKNKVWIGEFQRLCVQTKSGKERQIDVPAFFFIDFGLSEGDDVTVLIENSGVVSQLKNRTTGKVKKIKGGLEVES